MASFAVIRRRRKNRLGQMQILVIAAGLYFTDNAKTKRYVFNDAKTKVYVTRDV